MVIKPSCFLSYSFRKEDEPVVTFFKNLLEEEFEVLSAESEDKTNIHEKIFPKIRVAKACFAIFSKRCKIAERDDWTVPPDVLVEAGCSLILGQKVFGFIEIGIDARQQGLLRFSSTNYPRFDRRDLEAKRKDFRSYIKAAAQELLAEIIPFFDYTYCTKEVTVYRNGYGVIRNQYTVEFNKKLNEMAADHKFGGGNSAKNGYSLPHLTEMSARGPQVRKELGKL